MSDRTPTSVYLYYDANDVLVYVGITSRGVNRNREHNTSKAWWKYVVRQEVEHFPNREAAHAREIELIDRFTPPFNIQHNRAHAEMRAAYEYVAAQSLQSDPLDLVQSLGKSLPLATLRSDGNMHVFRTQAEHSVIATRLGRREAKQAKVIVGQERVGHIRKVDIQGPFALIHTTIRSGCSTVGASADLSIITGKEIGFQVRRVRLALPLSRAV